MIGRVVAVTESTAGSELADAVATTAAALEVHDLSDFNADTGGRLTIGNETHDYTVVEDYLGGGATVLYLGGPAIAGNYDEGEAVLVDPQIVERQAAIQVEGQGEELLARVPHALYALLDVGIRAPDDQEAVEAEVVDGIFVLTDILGREPAVSVGYLNGMEISGGLVTIDTSGGGTAIDSDPINHGLSGTPTSIVATVESDFERGTGRTNATYKDKDADTFVIRVRDATFGSGNEMRVSWMAMLLTQIPGQIDSEDLQGEIEDQDSGGTDVTGTD